jgi:hypothetical protein
MSSHSTLQFFYFLSSVCIEVLITVLHYGVIELRKAGSTDATLAVRKACMQNSRLCREDVSNSCWKTIWNEVIFKNYRHL